MSVSFQRTNSMAFRDLFGDFEVDGVGFGAPKPSQLAPSSSSSVTFDFLSGDFQAAIENSAAEIGSSLNSESKTFQSPSEIESFISEIMSDNSSDIDSISSPFSTTEESLPSSSPVHETITEPAMMATEYENFMSIGGSSLGGPPEDNKFSAQQFSPTSPLSGSSSPGATISTHGSSMGSPPSRYTINEYGTEFDLDEIFNNGGQSPMAATSTYGDQTPTGGEQMTQNDEFFQPKMTENSPSFEQDYQVYESVMASSAQSTYTPQNTPPRIAPSPPSFSPSRNNNNTVGNTVSAGTNFTIIQSPETQLRPNTPNCAQSEGSQIIKMNDVTYIVPNLAFQSQPIVLLIGGSNAQVKTEPIDLSSSPQPTQKNGQKRPLSPIQSQNGPTGFASKKSKDEVEQKQKYRNSDRKKAQNKRASKKYREGIKQREEERRTVITELETAKNRKKEEIAKLEGKNEVLKDQLLAKYAQLL